MPERTGEQKRGLILAASTKYTSWMNGLLKVMQGSALQFDKTVSHMELATIQNRLAVFIMQRGGALSLCLLDGTRREFKTIQIFKAEKATTRRDFALSSDGEFLAVMNPVGRCLELWSTSNNQQLLRSLYVGIVNGHCAAFSRDCKKIAVVLWASTRPLEIRVWSVLTGHILLATRYSKVKGRPGGAHGLCFMANDTELLLQLGDLRLRWDIPTGQLMSEQVTNPASSMPTSIIKVKHRLQPTVSKDMTTVVDTLRGNKATIFSVYRFPPAMEDSQEATKLGTFGCDTFTMLEWSPDGKWCAAHLPSEQSVKLLDAENKTLRILRKCEMGILGSYFVFSPDSALLAVSANDGIIYIFVVKSGALLDALTRYSRARYSSHLAKFSADNAWFVEPYDDGSACAWVLSRLPEGA
jgi:WD40 repeat protein